ncbi:TVP38/TMEM64 family protein [Bacillus inaquosorum]|uniref:TVP38/TMEM64 family protein n=1 Tax=Bacillus inaquosorum TaxID=483913 RepID=UPI0022816279|nr:TVP38/TMEM64 family protein [Bacillus inaquosorum]MCY8145382.1 TVP38/TMEM64 family protein [Bacillus inaquosorum]MCY8795577.1 TVP38/TMEM64 family protein [Bacillus inaquosorum]MCY8853820.1 TVP38/TMEM64 family protein [Bacillus inaquosorum]MEC0772654.1 TVP38/TMEM64 family protein [Bacillus inaquosorum]MEC0797961.1 TVP38/TMEM64 family protein [Bacillus inaquosorum]
MKIKTAVKWLAVFAGAGLIYWGNKTYLNLSPKEIRVWVLSFGVFAPLMFIGISIVRPLVLFPVSVISIAGGLAFGPLLGTLYTLFGSMCASAVSFFAAGLFAAKKNGHYEKLEAIQKQMEDNGFFYIFLLRILPINFDFVSYAAGLSNVKALPYFAATAAGIIPGTIALNVLGASFLTGNLPAFFMVLTLYIVFVSLPFIFRKKMQSLFQESN